MRLIAADAVNTRPTGDYAEQAVATTVYHCLTCGPVLREHLPDGKRVTWHLSAAHPHVDTLHAEEQSPLQ
jgi:hypothetical protein